MSRHRLRILLTNNTLAHRGGTELYVRDVAIGLLSRGHLPVTYSTHLGAVAEELRRASVPVVDDLSRVGETPDLIHGHHHLDTMTALLHFESVPAVYFCHGFLPWQEEPLHHPRILRYIAVDETCLDRLVVEHGIERDRVHLILNFVNLRRFRPRGPLPSRPRRALVFDNQAAEDTYVDPVREACARQGIELDVIGARSGNVSSNPESLLPAYDLVFATGRAALEAMVAGCTAVLCNISGVGPMVTSGELDRLRRQNFGLRALRPPVTPEALVEQIERYDRVDAARVSHRLRREADLESVLDDLERLYGDVLEEHTQANWKGEETGAVARYFRQLAPRVKELESALEEQSRLGILLEETRQKVAAAQEAADDTRRKLKENSRASAGQIAELTTRIEALAGENEALERRVCELSTALGERQRTLEQVFKSRSWRWTEPIRAFRRRVSVSTSAPGSSVGHDPE